MHGDLISSRLIQRVTSCSQSSVQGKCGLVRNLQRSVTILQCGFHILLIDSSRSAAGIADSFTVRQDKDADIPSSPQAALAHPTDWHATTMLLMQISCS